WILAEVGWGVNDIFGSYILKSSADLRQSPNALTWRGPPGSVRGAKGLEFTCGAGAAGRAPSAWRVASALRHSSAPPSDTPQGGSISRGIARGSCCIGCADGASAI